MSFADRVTEGARELRPARVLLLVVSAAPYILGVAAALLARAAWTVVAWAVAAARLGYRETWARRTR